MHQLNQIRSRLQKMLTPGLAPSKINKFFCWDIMTPSTPMYRERRRTRKLFIQLSFLH